MRIRFPLLSLLAATLLAGCATTTPNPPAVAPDNGVAALSAVEILAKTQAALAEATSYRVKGDIDQPGQKMAADLTLRGKDLKGTMTYNGVPVELIRVGTDTYLKAPDDFWKSQLPPGQEAAALLLLKGKYVKLSANLPNVAAVGGAIDAQQFLKPNGTVTKGEAKVVNGQPTIALVTTDGSLYVATTGKPYPIRIEGTGGQALDFSDFDVAVEITAPPATEVLDLSALLGG